MPLSELYRSNNHQKSTDISYIPNDEFVELIWEKGQIMMQGQSSKAKKTPVSSNFQFETPKFQDEEEEEMVPWLNYDYCSDEVSGLTVHEPPVNNTNRDSHNNNISSKTFSCSLDPCVRSGGNKPMIHRDPIGNQGFMNFSHFSRPVAMARASNLQNNSLKESLTAKVLVTNIEQPPYDVNEKSNPPQKSIEPIGASCSGNSGAKRKSEDIDCQSQDIEEETKTAATCTSTSTSRGSKRSRAAEVHNLSERRRRDRINEKMRALQELIPNCNKVDKASMLDEAIEYLKTLQLQVQIMSMGSGSGLYMPYPATHMGMGMRDMMNGGPPHMFQFPATTTTTTTTPISTFPGMPMPMPMFLSQPPMPGFPFPFPRPNSKDPHVLPQKLSSPCQAANNQSTLVDQKDPDGCSVE